MTDPSTAASLANERLARSRDSLRQAIRADRVPATPDVGTPNWFKGFDGLKALPGFDALLTALRIGWLQPLRQAGVTLSDVATPLLKPLAQRYPLALALGGVAIGAILVKLKPWRWLPAAAIVSSLAPQALGKIVSALPVQSWLVSAVRSIRVKNQNKPRI